MQPKDVMYSKDGDMFEVWRVLDDTVLAHPMYRFIYDADGDEYSEFEPASHLVSIPADILLANPPVAAVDQEIADRRTELAELKHTIAKEKREAEAGARKAKAELDAAKRELERWQTEHQHFIDLGRLLDGKPMFPLHSKDNHYHKSADIPSIQDWKHVKHIAVTPNTYRKDEPWAVYHDRDGSYGWTTRFFHSEQERNNFVSERFGKACEDFRKNPDFSTTSHTTSTRLHYGTLSKWCERFPHLAIPDDIVEGKAEADRAEMDAKAEKLRAELAALTA